MLADKQTLWTIGAFAPFKGLVIAAVALAMTSDLIDGLIIATVSGGLGIVGMVLSARITARTYRSHIQPDLADVKRQLGAEDANDPAGTR